jgi:hypothetical protein
MFSRRYRACLLCAISLLAGASSAHAEAVAAGVGVGTCAQFGQDYKNNPSNAEAIYNNWALGFLSGMNAVPSAYDRPTRDLQAMSFADKKQFLRDYCNEHPLELFMRAVLELALSLPVVPEDRPASQPPPSPPTEAPVKRKSFFKEGATQEEFERTRAHCALQAHLADKHAFALVLCMRAEGWVLK